MVEYGNWELYLHDIKGKIDRGELKPDPDWQRGYIWNLKDEKLLIDSILKGLPIPKLSGMSKIFQEGLCGGNLI